MVRSFSLVVYIQPLQVTLMFDIRTVVHIFFVLISLLTLILYILVEFIREHKKTFSMAAIIGIAVGGAALLLTLLCAGVFFFCRKKGAGKTGEATNNLGNNAAFR